VNLIVPDRRPIVPPGRIIRPGQLFSRDGRPRGFLQETYRQGRDKAVIGGPIRAAGGGDAPADGSLASFLQEYVEAGRDRTVLRSWPPNHLPVPPPPPPAGADEVIVGYQFQADGGTIDVTTEDATVSDPVGGVAPFTYAWEEVIPAPADPEYYWWNIWGGTRVGTITLSAPDAATTNWNWVWGSGGPGSGVWIYRCKITDATSAVFYSGRFLVAMTSSITYSFATGLSVPAVSGSGSGTVTSDPVTATTPGPFSPGWGLMGWLGNTDYVYADAWNNPTTTFSATLGGSAPARIVAAYYFQSGDASERISLSPPVKIALSFS
jgi:hypothetical protein